ncbi:DUF2255 family protein [Rhodococcus opacus]|uniref:DUF2255 family protein n=1 Tax=Rhodococcus opacus TaxID=37919 RepID=UPI001C441298|nr:DUF2255 family protein [Rhodococcus opacus]MBV6756664.1 DUF2255 family protein [Rhodococcus opacus]
MSEWGHKELGRIGGARQLEISTARRDGTFRSYITIWVVRISDGIYIRAYRGRDGSWFRQALRDRRGRIRADGLERDVFFEEADNALRGFIDAAYRAKYGCGVYVDAMIASTAAEATLELVPE